MAKSVFDTGTTLNIRVTFTDPDNGDALTDPTTVAITVRGPSTSPTTYTFGQGDEVIRESPGKFLFRLLLSEEGTYRWKWSGETSTKSVVVSDTCDSEEEVL